MTDPEQTGTEREERAELARFRLDLDLHAIDVLPDVGGMNDSPVKRHTDSEGICHV